MKNEDITSREGWSFWLAWRPVTNFPTLEEGLKVDVAILGGGIAGITAATLLKDAGHTVAVIEADRIVKGASSGATAKVTVGPDLIYDAILTKFGKANAQKFAIASTKSFEKIADFVREREIDCDFHRLPLYIYTESDEKVDVLKGECTAAKALGLPVSYTHDVPLPFPTGPALMYEDQAQFHPRKYLLALAEDVPGEGSHIFEKTTAFTVKSGDTLEVSTDHGSITADNVIVATHLPVYDPDRLYNHLFASERAYVLGLYAKGAFPDAMFVEFEPTHTYRPVPTDKGPMIIVAGEHSPAGTPDKHVYYKRLETYARQHLDVESIEYRWSCGDATTDDGLPIIGMTSQEGIYVATGFGWWGMCNGTTAAMVLTDLITGKQNQSVDIFDPLRFSR